MHIEVRCPNGHVLHVKEKYAGKIGICPRCSAPVRVPLAAQITPDEPGSIRSIHQPPAENPAAREPEGGRHPTTSDSAVMFGQAKQCAWCGKIIADAIAKCNWCGTPISNYRHLLVKHEAEAVVIQFDKHRILDERSVKEIAEELFDVARREGGRNLVLNLSKVFSLSSLILGRLVMLQKKLEQEGRQLTLCHVSPEIRDVLVATKLDQILRIKEA
jgi:anti-anti-sigma factor